MSLQPSNGDPSANSDAGRGMGGLSLDGEGLLRAVALSAAQDSGGGSPGGSGGAFFRSKGASSADASEARGGNSAPSATDQNGSSSNSSAVNPPQATPDSSSMAPPPPPKSASATPKPVPPLKPPSTARAGESVNGSVNGSVGGSVGGSGGKSGGKSAEKGEEEEEEDVEAPRGRRMRSSGMGGEIGGLTQMSWLRVPPPESARRRGRGGVTMSEVRQHRKLDDAWTVVRGKVYDITPYMRYHPGGSDMLMKGAGRDSSSLFNKYHAWVNVDFLLEKCLIGILVPE